MSSSVDDELERTKRQIHALVNEIAQMSKSDIAPDEYYAAFLQRIITAMAAVGGAVWIRGEGQKLSLAYQVNLSPTLLDASAPHSARHEKLLQYVAQNPGARLIPANSGNEEVGNPTSHLLVCAPLAVGNDVEGVLEVFQRDGTPQATQRGWLAFIEQMAEHAAEWLKSRRLKHLSDRHSLWSQADQFARLVHDTLDLKETCFTIANDGRRLIGCDRVSVGILRGKKCKIEAISGQDTLDNRSNIVYHLGRLAGLSLATGETFWYEGTTDDLPPQLEEAIHNYVEESYTKSLVILPLRKPKIGDDQLTSLGGDEELAKREIIGALIVEQLETELPRNELEPRVDLVYEHSARSLANALDHHNLFLMPLWKAIGHSRWFMTAKNLPWTVTAGIATLVVLAAMFVVPVPFTLKSKGQLKPVMKRDIFAPMKGQVETTVDEGDRVHKGQVILKLKNPELQQKRLQLMGDLATETESYRANEAAIAGGRLKGNDELQYVMRSREIEARIEGLENQIEIMDQELANLEVTSPIDGIVVTWDAKKLLQDRPVETGQILLEIADDSGGWQLELKMPERRAGHVRRYAYRKGEEELDPLTVNYVLMSETKSRNGKLVSIDRDTVNEEEDGACVRMRVMLDEENVPQSPRPNAGLMASVNCGRQPLGYYLFHEAWEYLRINWLLF